MKKFLSVVLTLMMVFSVFTTVSAATVEGVVSGIFTEITNPLLTYELPIEVVACETATDSYQGSPLNISGKASGTEIGVDFKATLKMQTIRDLFDSYTYNSIKGDTDAMNEFNNATVTSEITVTIEYPNVTVDTLKGQLVGANFELYPEVKRELVGENMLAITFKNRTEPALKASELSKEFLTDITFELKDAATYKKEGKHELKIEMEGKTTFDFEQSVDMCIAYKNAEGEVEETLEHKYMSGKYTVNIDYASSTGGGGTTRYALTYETDGGEAIDKETYTRNSTVKLSKVPKKEGYIFNGWYLDKELTEKVTEVQMTKNTTVYAGWVKDNGLAGNGYDTPEMLNGIDHFAYIVGYPDGTVKPNNNITRAEVTTIFFRLLKEDVRNMNLTHENNFSDVEILDWYNTAVSTMAKLGVINGRTADTFDPNAFITRAEFAAICARFAEAEFEIDGKFTDVAGHWAEKEIYEAAEYGWIRGYEDSTFKPDRYITRAEAMTMINRVLNRVPETADDVHDDAKKWSDNSDETAWYYIPVQEATNGHNYTKDNHIYETHTELTEDIDWTKYE